MISDIEEMFVKTGERKDAVKPKFRDVQFFLLINPKAGDGKGQAILEKNPKPFTYDTNFWKDLQSCAEIKQISVNFVNTDRPDKLAQFYSQVSKLTALNGSDQINQHIVIFGGDGSLSYTISELSQH